MDRNEDRPPSLVSTLGERGERMFPTLTPAQRARIEPYGRLRPIRAGEVLVEPGDTPARFYAVKTGEVEILRPSEGSEILLAVCRPGMFTGEATMLSGRRALVRIRASEAGELIDVDRERLMTLIQNDGELGEILLKAFVLRRVEIISRGFGDVVLLGSNHDASTLRIKEFLTRNKHPYTFVDLDRDEGSQDLLDRFHVSAADV